MTHIYERGQLVVPKYFRQELGWGSGTEVRLRIENNCLVVERKGSIDEELEGFARESKAKLGTKADFDDDYDQAAHKKHSKMGLGL